MGKKPKTISKSKFKARALEYFREVERTGQALVITDRGRPVLRLVPYREDPQEALKVLRDTVVDTGASFFEATTAIAFADFAARGADVAVVEVGLGGRRLQREQPALPITTNGQIPLPWNTGTYVAQHRKQ